MIKTVRDETNSLTLDTGNKIIFIPQLHSQERDLILTIYLFVFFY